MAVGLLERAVRSNALWCDAVCRSHGVPGELTEPLVWLTRGTVPRRYPNLVTLTRPADPGEQVACIRALAESGPAGPWAVKDSYGRLELAPLGFRPLFDASWLWWPAAPPATPAGCGTELRWTRVGDAAALGAWEAGWADAVGSAAAPPPPRVFLPSLLADARIVFLAAYQGGRLVAGAIGNHMAGVASVSNVFVRGVDQTAAWAGCLATLGEAFPEVPLVGYEAGDALALAERLGGRALGPLRVWLRAG
jgi:hypothetical protein